MYPYEKSHFKNKPPPYHTVDEWHYHNRRQYQIMEDRSIHAEKLIEQSDRARDRVNELINKQKEDTDWKFQKRITDIDFVTIELEKVGKSIQEELEVLGMLQDRFQDAIKYVTTNAVEVVQKCIEFRKNRTGIDLTHDKVEEELEKERLLIKESEEILNKALDQSKEFKRDLRASLYLLNKDIENKLNCLVIETECLNLKETYSDLSVLLESKGLDNANITVQEWARYSDEIMKSSKKKIHTAREFECYANSILEKVVMDLMEQYFVVNREFQGRILELKEAKARLETHYFEVARQVNDLTQSLAELEKSVNEKEGFLALAQTRLKKRSGRPGIELVRDEVGESLVNEVLQIRESVSQLQKMYSESQTSLRYLLKAQVQLEEEINVKTNSIKIDEVDCLTVRQGISYHSF